MASSAITSVMCSRMNGSPCPEPYCMACAPRSLIRAAMASPIASRGRSAMFGMPPASDTTSGRLATENRARTADTVSPWVRSA